MGVFPRSANMKLALIFCLVRLSLSQLPELPSPDPEQHQVPVEYYEGEDQYQQVYHHPSNPGTSYPGGVEASEYPEYQQYIQPVAADDQTSVYASDGQYEQPYDPYLNYPDYAESPALQYLEDEGRY